MLPSCSNFEFCCFTLLQQVVAHRNVAFLAAVRSLEEASATDTVIRCMWYLSVAYKYKYNTILFLSFYALPASC